MIADYYYYGTLSEKNQKLYKAIYDGIVRHDDRIPAPQNLYSQKDIQTVFDAVVEDNPHLFYLDQRQMSIGQSLLGCDVFLKYYFEMDTCRLYAQKVNEYVNAIINQSGANRMSSEYDKVKAIYDLLITKGSYDHKDDNNNVHDLAFNHTVLGLLLEKKAVCEGIARTFKLILNAIDIKCIVVSGFASRGKSHQEAHSWNIVKIDNESYHFDLTWGIEDSDGKQINYDYFGLNDEQIKKDHWDFNQVPTCMSKVANYFDRNGLVARKPAELDSILKKKCKENPVSIRVRLDYNCNVGRTAKYAQKKVMELMQNDFCQVLVSVGTREEQQIIHIDAEMAV